MLAWLTENQSKYLVMLVLFINVLTIFLYLKQYVVSSEEEEHSETYDTEDPSDVSGHSGLRAAIDSAKEDIIISIDYYADKYVARAKRDANNAMEALYQDLEKKYKPKNFTARWCWE